MFKKRVEEKAVQTEDDKRVEDNGKAGTASMHGWRRYLRIDMAYEDVEGITTFTGVISALLLSLFAASTSIQKSELLELDFWDLMRFPQFREYAIHVVLTTMPTTNMLFSVPGQNTLNLTEVALRPEIYDYYADVPEHEVLLAKLLPTFPMENMLSWWHLQPRSAREGLYSDHYNEIFFLTFTGMGFAFLASVVVYVCMLIAPVREFDSGKKMWSFWVVPVLMFIVILEVVSTSLGANLVFTQLLMRSPYRRSVFVSNWRPRFVMFIVMVVTLVILAIAHFRTMAVTERHKKEAPEDTADLNHEGP
jgi:hypothetical protein